MNPITRPRAVKAAIAYVALVAFALSGGEHIAKADSGNPASSNMSLSSADFARLHTGTTITREQTVQDGTRKYVGGVTYTIVEASPAELSSLFDDVQAYGQVLPRTKQASRIAAKGPDLLVELRQGSALLDTSYTIRIRKDAAHNEVRFWLDPTRPHGINDAWGFFRYTSLPEETPGVPRVLLTYGVLADFGPGLLRELFEERLRAVMLSVPQNLRRYLAQTVRHSPGGPAAQGGISLNR